MTDPSPNASEPDDATAELEDKPPIPLWINEPPGVSQVIGNEEPAVSRIR